MMRTIRSFAAATTIALVPGLALASEEAPMTVEGAITVTVDEAMELFEQGVTFVDVRKPSDYDAGRVPGSINLGLAELFSQETLADVVSPSDPVLFYCNGVACLRSSEASAKAVSWGYETVYYLRDGYPAWDLAGFPVE